MGIVVYFLMTKEQYDLKNIICPNCKIPEDSETINKRENSTMMLFQQQFKPLDLEGYDFYSIICFKCEDLTVIAVHPSNKKFYQYVETRKIIEADITEAKIVTRVFKVENLDQKLDMIKV